MMRGNHHSTGNVAIQVEGLSKLYRIGALQKRHDTLRDGIADLGSRVSNLVRRPSGARFGSSGSTSDTIWALQDVSFEVRRGEIIGVIGRNGAGKSTLLKVLSRITKPTRGQARISGRVGSLLEVGTGFHPELTGRENVFLNGAILGMRKAEIKRKFDEIVEFSGVEKFIDTPIKRFSSGMQVRLAFSVAAHLEPEILLVDEVLAVGDMEFQKKCLGKMRDVTEEGRTILLVSHNMTAIRNLCRRTLLFDGGRLKLDTATDRAVAEYLDQNMVTGAVASRAQFEGKIEGWFNRDNPSVRLMEITLMDEQGVARNNFQSDEAIRVSVTYECLTVVNGLRIIVHVVDDENRPILTTLSSDDADGDLFYRREPGRYESSCLIPPDIFGQKPFYISVELENPKIEHLVLGKVLSLDVQFKGYNSLHGAHWNAFLRPRLSWETQLLGAEQEAVYG